MMNIDLFSRFFLLFFLSLLLSFVQKNNALAQLSFPETYGYRVYDRESSFPLQNIQDIKQDSDNFIWCTSFNYFARLNGEGFTHFSNKILPEFKNSNFYQIAEDKDKNLWFGTYHELMKKNRFNQWQTIPIGQNIASINSVFITQKQEIYCSSDEKLFYLKDKKISEYKIDYTFKHRITNVVVGQDDDFYIGTEGEGLLCVRNGKVVKVYNEKNGLSNTNIISIGKMKNGEIWVGTTGTAYLLKNGQIIDLCKKYNLPAILYNYIFELTNGQILFGTKKGLWVVNKEGKIAPKILLEGKEVRVIFEDKEKNIWVGTYRDGLHQFFPSKFQNFSEKNPLNEHTIYCMDSFEDSLLTIGTNKGLFLMQKNNEITEVLDFKDMEIRDVIKDKNGKLWICASNQGLFYSDKKGKYMYFPLLGGMEKAQTRVLALYNDSLFVGTREGMLKIKDKSIELMSKSSIGLIDNFILSLFVDSQNRLWITTRNGLSLYQNGKIKNLTSENGLIRNTLFKVYEDHDKNIWAASSGLSLFQNGKFVSIPCDKLFVGTTSIYNILDDKKGILWLTSDIGIIKTAKKEVLDYLLGKTTKIPSAQMFDKNDGLLSGDITANSRYFFDKKHNLWIPGRGLFFINTENYFQNNIAPTAAITSVSVDENTILNLNDTLFLPPNDKMRLTIHFDAQSYIAPQKVIFQYLLEGFDNKWTTLGNKREITFTALPHGKYYFRIKACNNDGVWSEKEKVFVVIIAPAWYQTLAAKISLLIFMIAAIFTFIKIRTQALVKSKRELEEKVRLRTLTITEQSEELNQQASKLSLALNEISENNKVLQLFNEELTLKNQNIMDSINYARRIQASMLPKKEFIDEYFTDSFVLYKPKDVVSGDFYWTAIKKNAQEKITQMAFAVGDCTGHGVPGALLSMVGLEVLTQTANPPKMQPNIMLEKLEKGIRRTLQSEAEQSREGMEVSLCVIDLEEKNLYYSGANLPIYLFLNDEFCELTPTKKGINDTKRKAEIPFELKIMPLNGKIEIFMLSDGLKDQFGGQHDKKFSIKRIKELLEENHQKPMKEIGELFENQINDWMGRREQQIDDITLFGVRIFC